MRRKLVSPATLQYIWHKYLPLKPPKKRRFIFVRWLFPPHAKFKVNMDGSLPGNQRPSAGRVIVCDSMGGFVATSSIFLGFNTNPYAEGSVLLHRLHFCSSFGVSNGFFESDSPLLVQMIHHQATWPWRYYSDLASITSLIHCDKHTLCHVYRKTNCVADSVARLVALHNVLHSLFYPLCLLTLGAC